ncbi:DUF2249 domain-containing protein [Glycomyces sp. NRRL B-16210]|uniref:DUF2249 domain-containing protein n=1 Tax=Glycomyces sp. NRRL B-16210 TaxID=1463821 RepID=UPI00054FCD5A
MPKPQKHPAIFAAYEALPVGGAFILVNDHDPRHLRDEFEARHPGGHGWEYLMRERGNWRVRLTRLASTPLPRVLADAGALAADVGAPGVGGAVWRLQEGERDLDSNVIAIPPGGGIGAHAGPDVDVLVHVLAGGGRLVTERESVDLAPGAVVWLPRLSRRGFEAGADGLRYLTVHRRRQALAIADAPHRDR